MEQQPVETTVYSLDDHAPQPAERRDGERYLSLLRVGTLLIGDRRELCLIRNISAGGMLVRSYCRIEPETRLRVELGQGEPVGGIVKWTEGDTVGIGFDRPVDVVDLIANSMEGPRRRMPRVEVHCFASVREDGTIHRSKAVNISQGGVRIECASDLTVGGDVVVTLAGLAPAPAVVRWKDGGTYGLTFNRVLALPVLVQWLQGQREQYRAAS